MPFEVFSDVFFRNAAWTIRNGRRSAEQWMCIADCTWMYIRSPIFRMTVTKHCRSASVTTAQLPTKNRIFPEILCRAYRANNLNIALSKSFNFTPDHAFLWKAGCGMSADCMWMTQIQNNQRVTACLTHWSDGCQNSPFNGCFLQASTILPKTHVARFVNINPHGRNFHEAGLPRNFFGSIKLVCNFK